MLSLQDKGCHNINLVSPTHVAPQILEALEMAVELGLDGGGIRLAPSPGA